MTRWIEIYSPQSPPLRHELFDSDVTVGAGPEADLRLPSSTGLASVHFCVNCSNMGVTVKLQDFAPTGLRFEGNEARSVTLPWGSEVFIGNTRLTFLEGTTSLSSKGTTLLLAGALILGLTGIGFYQFQGLRTVSEPTSEAPALNNTGTIQCASLTPADAERDAQAAERASQAKEQRFPFDPQDGVAAVDMLLTTEACYRAAGKPGEASLAHAAMDKWSKAVNSEYSTVRLRLKYNLEHDRLADALKQIEELLAFLQLHGKGEYYKWLAETRETLLCQRRAAP